MQLWSGRQQADGGPEQGFGTQPVPGPIQAPPWASQPAWVVTTHRQVTQQAPDGWMQGFGSQTPSIVQIPVQAVWIVTVQVPSEWQQEPVGWLHGFGVQVPSMVQIPVQAAWSVTVQVPSWAQQEPLGWTHGLGAQVPSIVQIPEQAAWRVTVQLPLWRQQEPVGWTQGFGVQLEPGPWKVPPCDTQTSRTVMVQLPLWKQQAPLQSVVKTLRNVTLVTWPSVTSTV